MIRFIDLFAGIGGIRIPFDELGYQCVFSSEWDKAACVTYAANFGEYPQGDITKIPEKDIPPHDLLLAGFPCQAFSIMGKMQGFADTRGTMFFEIERILSYHKPSVILHHKNVFHRPIPPFLTCPQYEYSVLLKCLYFVSELLKKSAMGSFMPYKQL